MKKTIITLIFILAFRPGVFGEPTDLVLILDTSASMSNSYRETSDYLIGPFLREFLRIGDTFHLISFSGSPRLEISRRVEGIGDVEAIIGRLLLMYPLGPESNLSGALGFAENFASSLPGARPKKIVLLSDDADGDTQSLVNATSERLRRQGAELQYIRAPVTGTGPSSGRPREYVSSPTTTRPPAATPPAATTAPPTTATVPPTTATPPPATTATVPPATATTPPATTAPPTTTPPPAATTAPPTTITTPPATTTPPVTTAPPATTPPPAATTAPPATTPPPAATTAPPITATVPPTTTTPPTMTGAAPTSQTQITPQAQAEDSSGRGSFLHSIFQEGFPLRLLILILLNLLVLGLIIFFAVRNLHKSPNRAMARAAVSSNKSENKTGQAHNTSADNIHADDIHADSPAEAQRTQAGSAGPSREYQASKAKPLPKDKTYPEQDDEGDSPMLNLFVADQNTAIGRRNIHSVKAGNTFSIGGGNSDFLVFLVPIPPRIADLQYDGKTCTLIPKKSQYFPDLGSEQLPNCVGKNIRVVSDRNYELHIRVEKYEDPLRSLNRLLNSISVPGEKRE